jgi:spore maturation protein CgeB
MRAEALRTLGHDVGLVRAEVPRGFWRFLFYRVGNRIGRPPDVLGANRRIVAAFFERLYDILWIDKGRTIRPETLDEIRMMSPSTVLLNYSPDDMMNPANQSVAYRAAIPKYDLHVTTKSYNVAELRERGAQDALFIDNAFDPQTHRPMALSDADRQRYDADLSFIGGYEEDRARQMLWLGQQGLSIKIWGYQWERLPASAPGLTVRNELLRSAEYAKAICGTRINLGFLRKVNRDLQTTRSMEIPACGAFMLAERTDEHLRLFEEGKEAEFFSTREELLQKCRYYLEHPEERARIAQAGLERCKRDGYSNAERLRQVIDHVRPILRGDVDGESS